MPEELDNGLILVYGHDETDVAREQGYYPSVDEFRAEFSTFHEAYLYSLTIPVPATIVYNEETDTWEVYVDYAEG